MAKSIGQRIKDTTPKDILLTGLFVGVLAAVSGAAHWVDGNLLGDKLGFKSQRSNKQLVAHGAIIGGISSIPFAYYSATSVLDDSLGSVFVNPTLKGELPPAPKDYVYSEVEGQQPYLILDPKYGL